MLAYMMGTPKRRQELSCKINSLIMKYGGAKGDRTPDLLHAMQALSQLSYGPNWVRTAAPAPPAWITYFTCLKQAKNRL